MNLLILFLLLASGQLLASIVGISTHPLSREARVLSAEMTGYMSLRQEVGMGLRYTQELNRHQLFDVSASGGQDSRSFMLGTGVDFELLSESNYQPRVGLKPFAHYQRFENTGNTLLGLAPSLRKGFAVMGNEFFPYLALPVGMRIDSTSLEFNYYSSITIGASMPFPGDTSEKVLLSVEGNKNMGASSDYIGCLVSWIWK
jgi:hypothetical protein